MRVRARFFALYREAVGQREAELEVSEGTTVADLWGRLGQEFPRLAAISPAAAAVNAEYVPLEAELHEGDEVAFLPPVSGG
ncbi:MAG TPA: molybdopterin converting factor subunit 1 [Anaerolineae bacterium]|nr:molybdopterin converting factor subunit 1 [Anaerolineae bacterium]